MNKKLRESVKAASDKLNEAECAVQRISKYLCFSGFFGDEPVVSDANGSHEIFLVWNGSEMPIDDAILRMEEYGYITPDDFI